MTLLERWITWRYGLLPTGLRPPLGFSPVWLGFPRPTIRKLIGHWFRYGLWLLERYLYEKPPHDADTC